MTTLRSEKEGKKKNRPFTLHERPGLIAAAAAAVSGNNNHPHIPAMVLITLYRYTHPLMIMHKKMMKVGRQGRERGVHMG